MLRASILTVTVLLIALAFILRYESLGHSASTLRRITRSPDEVINLNPSLSGDGRYLAFESSGDLAGSGTGQGFHALSSTLDSEPFTFHEIAKTRAVTPGMSHDGSTIVFSSAEDLVGRNPDRNYEIFLNTNAQLTQLTETSPGSSATRTHDGSFQPSISDDGRLVAFSSNRNLNGNNTDLNFEIFFLNTSTHSVTQLTDTNGIAGSFNAKISGNGSHMVFIRDSGTPSLNKLQLLYYDCATHLERTIVDQPAGLELTYGRAISNSGSRVVYSCDSGEHQSQVFLFDANANNSRQITTLGSRSVDIPLNATISGDGKRIAFATRRRVITATDGGVELYVFDLPSARLTQVTNAPSSATAEIVSSLNDDGSVLAFNFPRVLSDTDVSNETANNSEIYIANISPRAAFGPATVLNAAAVGNEGMSPAPLPRGGLVIAKGDALASQSMHAKKSVNGQFPLSLAGTNVTINDVEAQLLYVSPTEVTLVIPTEITEGPAEIVISNGDGFRSVSSVMISSAAPGIFTENGDGHGRGVVLNANNLTAYPFDPTNGQLWLNVFATGVRNATNVAVSIGGQRAVVGPIISSADVPGLDEIHVMVPAILRGFGDVVLVIEADGRQSNSVVVSLSGSSIRDVVINELLADPPDGIAGDANHDGVRNSADDEFVELVNSTGRDLDLTGYQLQTRSSTGSTDVVRHRFSTDTILSAGTALVVFGGGSPNPSNPVFAGALILKASSGGLSLVNSGGTITLRDAAGSIMSMVSYGGATGLPGDTNESLTRFPDIIGTLVPHRSTDETGQSAYSPGSRVNGEPFLATPAISSIELVPNSASLIVGEEKRFAARAVDVVGHQLADVLFRWESSNPTVVTIDQTGLAKAVAPGPAFITASARMVTSVPCAVDVSRPLPSPTPSPSPSPGASPTPSPSPQSVPPVVISEFRTRGPAGASDEFIELYNRGDLPIDVSGWKIKGSSNTGTVSTRFTISSGTVIPARGHFLATNSAYTGTVAADQVFSSGVANDGGLGLTLPNDVLVDQVGLSSGSAFREGAPLPPLTTDANFSYERKPGGLSGSTQDTNDNLNDFLLVTPSDPQHLLSPPTPGPSPPPTPTPSVEPSPSPSPTVSPTPSPSPSPTTSPSILISEFRSRGPNGASDEFIEVYNPNDSAVSIGGWKIKGSSSAGTVTTRATVIAATTIPGYGHFLVTNSSAYSGVVAGDQTYTTGIADDGGVAITNANDVIIDAVGMSPGSAFREGSTLAPQANNSNQSYERRPGGLAGSAQDTNNNALDFQLIGPSDPQNLSSSPTPGSSPTPTPTPSQSPTPSPSPSPSATPTPSPSPVQLVSISQVYGGGGNSGAAFRNDFIELLNRGSTAIDLNGWSVQYSSAGASTWTVTPLAGRILAPGQYYLIQEGSGGSSGGPLPSPDATGSINLASTAGKVALVNSNVPLTGACPNSGAFVDLVGYGTSANCFEGTGPAPSPGNTTSAQRKEAGCIDSQNNADDFTASQPAPHNSSSDSHLCTSIVHPQADHGISMREWIVALLWQLTLELRI